MESSELNQLANLVSQIKETVAALEIKVDALQITVTNLTNEITLGTIDADSLSIKNLNGRNLKYTDDGIILKASEIKLNGKMHKKNRSKTNKGEE